MQASKQVALRTSTVPNQENGETWNITASIFNEEKQAQSQHSIRFQNKKASSTKNSSHKGKILEYYIYEVVLSELNKYKQIDEKHNGMIRIIDSKMFVID